MSPSHDNLTRREALAAAALALSALAACGVGGGDADALPIDAYTDLAGTPFSVGSTAAPDAIGLGALAEGTASGSGGLLAYAWEEDAAAALLGSLAEGAYDAVLVPCLPAARAYAAGQEVAALFAVNAASAQADDPFLLAVCDASALRQRERVFACFDAQARAAIEARGDAEWLGGYAMLSAVSGVLQEAYYEDPGLVGGSVPLEAFYWRAYEDVA